MSNYCKLPNRQFRNWGPRVRPWPLSKLPNRQFRNPHFTIKKCPTRKLPNRQFRKSPGFASVPDVCVNCRIGSLENVPCHVMPISAGKLPNRQFRNPVYTEPRRVAGKLPNRQFRKFQYKS